MQQFLISTILFIFYVIPPSKSIQCFICGSAAYEPFKNNEAINNDYSKNRSCEEMDSERTNPEEFIMECPANYVGCITQINGTEIIRTCEQYDINDCQIANRVLYCYCNTNLCNGLKTNERKVAFISKKKDLSKGSLYPKNIHEENELTFQENNKIAKVGNGQNIHEGNQQFIVLCILMLSVAFRGF